MDLKTISALAVKMNITQGQFDSFKFFIYYKYKSQLNSPNKQWDIEEILKKIKSELPSERELLNSTNHSKKKEKSNKVKNENKLDVDSKVKPKLKKKKRIKTNINSRVSKIIVERESRKTAYRRRELLSIEESNILRIKTDYIRKPHTVKMFVEKMYWDLPGFIDWLNQRGFKEVSAFSMVKLDYLEPIIEKILDRRREIIKWETEIVTRNITKTKPNFFKLIYNSTGSKR